MAWESPTITSTGDARLAIRYPCSMGHVATIYGCIDGLMGPTTSWTALYEHNVRAIAALPVDDDAPPLCRGMFAVTSGRGTSWQRQAIHFGWSTKGFEHDFVAWQRKFEGLLATLWFTEARLHIEQEIQGDAVCRWEATAASIQAVHDAVRAGAPLPDIAWRTTFTGDFLRFVDR